MTEEEKEAIENLEKFIGLFYEFPNPQSVSIRDYEVGNIETALNLIQKQQEEIEKKDKIINEMAKYIATLDTDEEICKNVINIGKSFCPEDDCDNLNREVDCDACIKQYFKRKAEEV